MEHEETSENQLQAGEEDPTENEEGAESAGVDEGLFEDSEMFDEDGGTEEMPTEEEGAEFDESGEEEDEDDDEDDEDEDDGDEEEQAGDDDAEDYDDGDDDEGDGEDDNEDDEDDDDEDDDDEWENIDDSQKCPVCLDAFWDKEVGTPESCDHVFCLDCILEWSRNINTCPVDRSLFRSILVRHSLHGEVVRRVEVDERKAEDRDDDDATYCEVCGRCDREDRLLLCDGCDAGYHCECLDPPLEHIPIEEWYCPECVAQNRHQEESSEEELEIVEPETVEPRPSRPAERREDRSAARQRRGMTRERPPARAIARTHVSERVRARVTRARAAEQQVEQRTTGTRRLVRKKPAKRKTTKKRKTVKRRRATAKKKISSKTGTTKTPRKKRKFKRRKKRRSKATNRVTKAAAPKTIRARIAGKLMLVKPRTGSMMPDMKVKGQQSLGLRRSEIGAAALTITGSDNLLDPSETASSSYEAPTTSTRTTQFVLPPSTPDLLGSIISSQDMLLMPSKDVTIHRDGSLTKNSPESKPRQQGSHQSRGQSPEESNPKRSSTSPSDTKRTDHPSPRRPSQSDGVKRTRFHSAGDGRDVEKSPGPRETEQGVARGGKNHEEARNGGADERRSLKMSPEWDVGNESGGSGEDDDDVGDAFDDGEEGGRMEEMEETEDNDQITDSEKVSGKHDGSITCQASSSSFEESHSEEEGAIEETKSPRRSKGRAGLDEEEEGLIPESEHSKHGARRGSSKARGEYSRKGSGRSRRKSSLEEGLIEEDADGMPPRQRSSFSEEEGLIEEEHDPKMRSVKHHTRSHSEEEGLIADDEDGGKSRQAKEVAKETRMQGSSGGHTGHSSAEEGEVKTDEEEGSSGTRKKRKRDRERGRQRSRKDTRTVVIDSEMLLAIPKRPMVEIQREQKLNEARNSEQVLLREREFDHPGEHGVFGDLRHVIQVKRDVPYKRPSRYENYWAELERQRAIESQLVEKSVPWERVGMYERPYPYEGDWNRMMVDRKPLEPQWENFTIHRERSPVDWRKEREEVEGRVDAERRIEMVQQMDHDRRFESKRRDGADQKLASERRLPERKGDARKEQEVEKKPDSSRTSVKKAEVDKGRSDLKKVSESKREGRPKVDVESKNAKKAEANRRPNPNPGGENSRQKPDDGKRESRTKRDSGHPEKERFSRKQDRDRHEKGKHKGSTDEKKRRELNKSDPQIRNPKASKPSGSRDKDGQKEKRRAEKQELERDNSKDGRGRETTKRRVQEQSSEHSRDKDRVQKHERSERDHPKMKQSTEKQKRHSGSRSKERSTSRGHSDHSSKHSHDRHPHDRYEDPQKASDRVDPDKPKRGSSGKYGDDASAPTEKDKKSKDGSKSTDRGRSEQSDVQQATSTSDKPIPAPAKPTKRSIRRARSPSSSQTGETGDELDAAKRQSSNQLPITVPATEMVSDKPVLEKVKKKKKDKTKKLKNKSNEKTGVKGKKGKKAKGGKAKKQKAAEVVVPETEANVAEETKDDEPLEELPEDLPIEHPDQSEEATPELPVTVGPAMSPVVPEPSKIAGTEDTTEQATEIPRNQDDEENTKEKTMGEDSSSDVEVVIGPVRNIYDEIIDLSQISSDEESFRPTLTSAANQGKDNSLYDPFEPTASPETISSPDISHKYASHRQSQRSRYRSPTPDRRTRRSPLARRSSPKPLSSRQRSVSPKRRSPTRQRVSSRDHGHSSRKQSVTPLRKSLQKRRSPSPRRNMSIHKRAHSPRRSPTRSQRRSPPKRQRSPRKRSLSPREQSSSKRWREEPPRQRSVSPRKNVYHRKRKASPKKSISPQRRHISPKRRSRSPRKRSKSPRYRAHPQKRSISPRKQSIPSRRRSNSPRRQSPSPKRRRASPPRHHASPPRHRIASPRRQTDSSGRQRRSMSQHRSDSSSKKPISRTRSISPRSSSTSSRSSRSPSSSSSWSSSTNSWSSSSYSRSRSDSRSRSYSRSPSYSGSHSLSRSPSPRSRRYSRDRSSSSLRSESSISSDRSTALEMTPLRRSMSPSPKRAPAVLRQSPTQTSPEYRHRIPSESEKQFPVQPRQELPDSTQGSYRLEPRSPASPDQTMAPATSTTDSHLASKASSQITHILGQLASNPAIQSAINSANLQTQRDTDDSSSSEGSISGFLKSSETSFNSPSRGPLQINEGTEDKDLQSLADVSEDNIESSAVDLYNKHSRERYLKKLQHQERVVEEVKLALKPYYQKREVTKEDYKEILRKSVNQVCHSKSGEINPVKIKRLIEGYIKKFHGKKKLEEKKEPGRPDLTFRLLTKS